MLALTGAALFYGATSLRVVMNGTTSLPHTAYLMVAWPKVLWRGGYVAVEPPADYADRLQDLVVVKEVVGLAGDDVGLSGGDVCLNARCFAPFMVDGKPFDDPLAAQVIPEGAFAAFATAPDSLDSRYASVGLFRAEDVIAIGWPIPFPHWTEMQAWLAE